MRSPPSELTLMVVTYEGDYDMFRRLLASAQQHWQPGQVREMLVGFNDREDNLPELLDIIASIQPTSFPVTLVLPVEMGYDFKAMIDRNHSDGWHRQQIWKLKLFTKASTDWAIIHDSKDHYTDAVAIDSFFNEQGLAKGTTLDPTDAIIHGANALFLSQYRMACRLMDVPFDSLKGHQLKSVTPFVCPCKPVLSMLKQMESRGNWEKSMLPPWGMLTEFGLINAAVTKEGIGRYYDTNSNWKDFFSFIKTGTKDLRRK